MIVATLADRMPFFWIMRGFRRRLGEAWRAFQGDHWADPRYVVECNREMAEGAMDCVHDLLDRLGIPRGTFADDHVTNLVVCYNKRGKALKAITEFPIPDATNVEAVAIQKIAADGLVMPE